MTPIEEIALDLLEKKFLKYRFNDKSLVDLATEIVDSGVNYKEANILLGRIYESIARLRENNKLEISCICGEQITIIQKTSHETWECPLCEALFDCPSEDFGHLIPNFYLDSAMEEEEEEEEEVGVKAEKATLCLDFGTSSIRAGFRLNDDSATIALELGDSIGSSIDRASIPSAILINRDRVLFKENTYRTEIIYGEEALTQVNNDDFFLFEVSPKKWLLDLDLNELNEDYLEGISRKNLISGLLSTAIATSCGIQNIKIDQLEDLEIRVSHPVWLSDELAAVKNQSLKEITQEAINLVKSQDGEVLFHHNLDDFRTRLEKSYSDNLLPSAIDVEEPIAASLELFQNDSNSRELCLLVDIGAGTTDLAFFLSTTPEVNTSKDYDRRIKMLDKPISLYKAGDFLDEQLLEEITSRKRLDKGDLASLRNRKRLIKEELFENGKIFEFGISVKLESLLERKEVVSYRTELTEAIKELCKKSADKLDVLVHADRNPVTHIDVIMAGGGAQIDFLKHAIEDIKISLSSGNLPLQIREIDDRSVLNLPANIQRLAVALGGVTPANDWPIKPRSNYTRNPL